MVHAFVATTFAPWLALVLIRYHVGAWVATVPPSGQASPVAPVLTGDMPPPSRSLTVQRVTPAGVSPALCINAQRACSSTVVPEAFCAPPREMNDAWFATPAAAMSAIALAMLCASAVTPAGSPVGPARTKSLVKIACPNWLFMENPPETNWFSRDAAWTMSMLGPPLPLSAFWIAVPVADPVYLKVNCGNAAWNWGWIRFGIRPESLISLVPTIDSDDALSAVASAGASIRTRAAKRPSTGRASSRRRPGRTRRSAGSVRRPLDTGWVIAPAYRGCLCNA